MKILIFPKQFLRPPSKWRPWHVTCLPYARYATVLQTKPINSKEPSEPGTLSLLQTLWSPWRGYRLTTFKEAEELRRDYTCAKSFSATSQNALFSKTKMQIVCVDVSRISVTSSNPRNKLHLLENTPTKMPKTQKAKWLSQAVANVYAFISPNETIGSSGARS